MSAGFDPLPDQLIELLQIGTRDAGLHLLPGDESGERMIATLVERELLKPVTVTFGYQTYTRWHTTPAGQLAIYHRDIRATP